MKIPGVTSFLLLTALSFLLATSVAAQSAAEDSMLYKKAVSSLIALYHQSAGDQSGLFNGSQYGGYGFSFTEGNPFFYSDKPTSGSVLYDGVLYENVSIQFDEVKDAIIILDSSHRIQLLNPRIEQFSLFNNNFRHIVKDSQSTELVRTGFYNILYEGAMVSLLKKEEKTIREDVSTGEIRRFIDINEYYYLKRNNTYYSIKSKSGILNLFKDKKKEIRQYINKNDLSYRKDRQNMLTKITAYYDQLIK